MPYIGNPIYQSAFVTDTFSGNGTTTAFTMSVAPAGTTNVLVAVSGVLQDPSTYGVVGTTLNFSAAPPTGTGNISVRYLGVPATGVTTTAYRTVTEFTATAGQTTFTPPSYTVGFIDVYRNGVLLGSADFTATNGTTVVLANPATAGDLVETISFLVSSVLNAIPNTAGSVSSSNIQSGVALTSPTMTSPTISSGALTIGTTRLGAGDSSSFKNRIINGDFSIAQRATSSASGGYCCVDRWSIQFSTAALTASQTTATVNGVLCNVLNIAGNVGNTASFQFQRIESANSIDMAGQNVTLSFWVYHTTGSAKTFSATLGYATATDNFGSVTNIGTVLSASVPNATWTLLSGTIAVPSVATTGLQVQINGGATTSNFYQLAMVQLEKGSVATSFDYLPYGTELQLCQRYAVLLGTIVGGYTITIGRGMSNGGNSGWRTMIQAPVPMRAVPTLTPVNLSGWNVSSSSVGLSNISTVYMINGLCLEADINYVSGVGASNTQVYLQTNGSGGASYLLVSAEL
jgi:hypothetical protein